jgi:mRNA-degrading endonuclease RelE of RelBE toxin-antitoxin system
MAYLRFVRTRAFQEKWKKLELTENDYADLRYSIQDYFNHPPANSYGRAFPGDLIQDTGGAIKLRFAPKNEERGKSGAYRIIYCFVLKNEIVFLLLYAHKEQSNLTKKQKKRLRKTISRLRDRRLLR